MNALNIYSAPSYIHSLVARIPLNDEEYRNMLYDLYSKRSSKELTPYQQSEFIGILKKQLRVKKYDEFKRRTSKKATLEQRKLATLEQRKLATPD